VDQFFEAVGRVVGLALASGNLMGVAFAKCFLKGVLGEKNFELDDLRREDPILARGFKALLEHPVDDIGYEGELILIEHEDDLDLDLDLELYLGR